jgi:hypothetical protein
MPLQHSISVVLPFSAAQSSESLHPGKSGRQPAVATDRMNRKEAIHTNLSDFSAGTKTEEFLACERVLILLSIAIDNSLKIGQLADSLA